MAVASRQGLIDYCLRALGEPVVEINVDESQLSDRVDEALEYWYQYHWDGSEKFFMKHIISASEIRLTSNNAETFDLGSIITGGTSGATAMVVRETKRSSAGNLLLVKNVKGTFADGETITSDKGQSGTLDASPVTLGSYDKHYLDIPDLVYGVTRVIPFANASSSKNIFDLQYQLRLNDLYDLTATSLIYYKTVMSHLSLLSLELNGYPQFRFNRRQNRLYLDVNWDAQIALGDFIVIECYRALDPAEFTKVWDEPWLKHYVIALFKKQWGMNGKKFNGVLLPGNVSIDFQKMYDEAVEELKVLEDELQNKAAPLEFFVG